MIPVEHPQDGADSSRIIDVPSAAPPAALRALASVAAPAWDPDDILADVIRRVIDVWEGAPVSTLRNLERDLRKDWGGERVYVAKVGESGRQERSQREAAIREDYRRGAHVRALARKWGISPRRVQQILRSDAK